MTDAITNFWGDVDTSGQADYTRMTPSAKALRDKFVNEYLVDFDAYRAAIRCGYVPPYAEEHAAKLMKDPYVMQQLSQRQDTLDTDPEVIKKRVLSSLLKEANYTGPGSSHAARVTALTKLAAIHGLEPDGKGNMLAGNVLVVPAISNVDDWEAAATKQQEDLVRD